MEPCSDVLGWWAGDATLGTLVLNFQLQCWRNDLGYKGRNNTSQSVPASGPETLSVSFYVQRQLSQPLPKLLCLRRRILDFILCALKSGRFNAGE